MELEYDPLAGFGRHLAATRRQAGVSQEALAHDSGLSRSYVSEIERGLRNVALRNICILAETLKLPPSALMEFEKVTLAVPAKSEGRSDSTREGVGGGKHRPKTGGSVSKALGARKRGGG